jgi:hypothetical protein
MILNPIRELERVWFGGKPPSYILDLLFCSELDHSQLMTIGAFFYGNYVNFQMSANALMYCNVHCDGNKVHVLRQLFGMWWRSYYERSRRSYYNMWIGDVFDLNQNPVLRGGRQRPPAELDADCLRFRNPMYIILREPVYVISREVVVTQQEGRR